MSCLVVWLVCVKLVLVDYVGSISAAVKPTILVDPVTKKIVTEGRPLKGHSKAAP